MFQISRKGGTILNPGALIFTRSCFIRFEVRAVSSRAEIAAVCAASAVLLLHRGSGRAVAAGVSRSRYALSGGATRPRSHKSGIVNTAAEGPLRPESDRIAAPA